MTWYYQDKELNDTPDDYFGFVYLITNLNNGMKYVGKKLFHSTRRIKQKNTTRRKVVTKDSDWRDYYGSNKVLLEDISRMGDNINVKREILHLCKTRGECSYKEAEEQFSRNVLMDDTYYNDWIIVKVHKKHLTKT